MKEEKCRVELLIIIMEISKSMSKNKNIAILWMMKMGKINVIVKYKFYILYIHINKLIIVYKYFFN